MGEHDRELEWLLDIGARALLDTLDTVEDAEQRHNAIENYLRDAWHELFLARRDSRLARFVEPTSVRVVCANPLSTSIGEK